MKKIAILTVALLGVLFVAQAEPRSKRRAKAQTQTQAQSAEETKPAVTSLTQPEAPAPKQGSIKSHTAAKEQPQAKSQTEKKAEAKAVKEVNKPQERAPHSPRVSICDSLKNSPVKPIKPINDNVIDTLATADKNLSVILFNDNTWRYVQTGNIEADKTVFAQHWNEEYLSPYYNVPLTSIPETVPIQLVDSLRAYHYPYKGHITSRFGPRHGRRHAGVDISLRLGDTIRAVFNGKVRYSKCHENGYGELIIIRHDNGLETYNAHLSKRLVKPGQRVAAGEVIGLGGSTGRSTGPHLHFEFRYMGQSFDPERIIDFKTGNLRRDFFLLKRSYFDTYSKYEQDFNGEKVVATTTTTTTASKPATSTTAKPSTSTTSKSTNSTSSKSSSQSVINHKLQSGETISHLAVKYNTTSKKIQELNPGLALDKVKAGQVIRVKPGSASKSSSSTSAQKGVYHTLASGETISHLAVKYNTTTKKIQELNPGLNPDKVRDGQKIRVK